MARPQFRHLFDGHFVVAEDAQVDGGVQFAQALHQVVSEGIVVVDEDEHGRECFRGWRPRFGVKRAF